MEEGANVEGVGDAEGPRLAFVAAQWHEALGALDRALSAPPEAVSEDVDVAERATVRVRDALIEALRGRSITGIPDPRRALDRVNAALSVIVGVEYPVRGVQRSWIAESRDALRAAGTEELGLE